MKANVWIFENNLLKEEEINYSVNAIKYIDNDNKERRYFADFYIPKWNLIVEIKSSFTNKLDKYVLLKEQACLSQGFKYIKIINNIFEEFDCLVKQLTKKSLNLAPYA
jgi:very-short-patch-repair endonuclease